MKIATYYESLYPPRQADDLDLIELWKESWEKRGFETVVLDFRHADGHPDYQRFREVVSNFPTVNGKEYELHCFLRHLAFARSSATLFSDFDAINYSLNADESNLKLSAPFHSFFNGGPSLFTATPESMQWLIRCIMNWRHAETIEGVPHLSDQTIFLGLPISRSDDMQDYGPDGWEKSAVIHYSNQFFGPGKKAERIQLIKPL